MEIVHNRKENLKNNGDLEVYFIGTGSAFALKHFQTNFLIIKGDTHIMVDFGSTAPYALASSTTLSLTDIEVVLPTHSHSDHVGGLEQLALMNRYIGRRIMSKKKLKMIIDENYQRILWTHTLQGGLEWNEKAKVSVHGKDGGQKLQFSDFFDVIRPTWKVQQPREVWQVNVGDIKIDLFRTNHIPEQEESWEASFISYGLFVDDRIFISGDTKFDLDLINMYADRSEIMFHDVQFFKGAVHAPLDDLKTLPDEIKQKMYLMHYSDNYFAQDISDFAGWAEQSVSYIF